MDNLHLACTLPGESLLLAEGVAAVDLELIDGDASHVGSGELGDVACRTGDPTSTIEDLGAMVDSEATSEVVLVAEDRTVEVLTFALVGEVE